MFAFVWMALLPLCLMSAFVGVLLWVWVALLSPNELLAGFMAGVPFNKIVAVCTLALLFVSREKKQPYLDATLTLLLLFGATSTVSWLLSLAPSADGDELYQKLLKEIVLAFTITAVMTTRHRIDLLVLTVVASLGFLAVKEGLISVLTSGGHLITGSGSVGDNNSVATALLMIMPFTAYLARYSAVRVVRIGLMLTLVLAAITVVMTFSRGGFVGMLILAMFMVKNSKNKATSLLLVAAGAVAVFVLAPSAWFDRLNTIQDANNDGSFMGRVVAWKMSWLIAMDHPLFGGGPHAVQHLSVWNTYKPQIASLDFIATPPPDMIAHAAHSIYFEILGDTGFVGLGLFLTMVLTGLRNCSWISRHARGHPTLAWASDLARMGQVSLVLYLATGAALSMGYFELLYIVLALLSRCRRIVQKQLSVETARAERGYDAEMADGAAAFA